MKIDLENELVIWKNGRDRQPVLVRGARQVGKSYTIEEFGKQHFHNLVTVNFEFQPELKKCFTTLVPSDIINKIQLLTGSQIYDEKTLLFLDEIQECPNAIMSLRYFKEQRGKLAVIGAGSLMEFALNSPDFRMPVGRVQFLYLEPLSFGEFLAATGNGQLRQHLSAVRLKDSVDDAVHARLMELLRTYIIVGGMPAVVKEYLVGKNFADCSRIQNSLLQTY